MSESGLSVKSNALPEKADYSLYRSRILGRLANLDTDKTNKESQLVTFCVGTQEYALEIMRVVEVIRPTIIRQVPGMPSIIKGVIDLREKVVPIIDLREYFHNTTTHDDTTKSKQRIIISEINDRLVGLIVDSVSEVLAITQEEIETPSEIVTGVEHRFVIGVVRVENRFIIYIDIIEMFAGEDVLRYSKEQVTNSDDKKSVNGENK